MTRRRYQDYVIKNGRLIGDFEQMYRDCEDPWEQVLREDGALEKAIALEIVRREGFRRVLELGCGLGGFTAKLAAVADSVLGVDVSATAIAKAKVRYPKIEFQCADLLSYDTYRCWAPDCVVMAEITWYVLDKLDTFKVFLQKEMPGRGFIHLLMTYREGEQKYGREYFTDLDGIIRYWDCVDFTDWGTVSRKEYGGGRRTFCFGRIMGGPR